MAADCRGAAAPSLSDLPEEALMAIIRQLDARQLAALLVQDRRLAALGSDAALWQKHAQARWPGCSAAHYGGDWRALYRTRAALPRDLVRAADRCHALTLRASNGAVRLNSAAFAPAPAGASPPPAGGGGGACASGGSALRAAGGALHGAGGRSAASSPQKVNVYGFSSVPYCNITGMLLEEAMQAVFTIGLSLAAARGGGGGLAGAGTEVARFQGDIAWWLAHRPEVVMRFVKRTSDALREYDMWGSGFSGWPEVPWRRSALQFILDLALGPHSGVCMSVSERLQREAAALDAAIAGLKGEACHLDVRRPSGVPRSHWWFYMQGAAA